MNVELRSQNAWYCEEARRELGRLTGECWTQLVALRGEQEANAAVEWQRAMIEVLDSGDFCPANFRAQKPLAS